MSITQSPDKLEIVWVNPDRVFTGAWFFGIGLLSLPLLLALRAWQPQGEEGSLWLIVLMPLVFAAAGLAVMLNTYDQRTVIHKDGKISVTRTRRYHKVSTSEEHKVSDFRAVDLFEFVGPFPDKGTVISLTRHDGSLLKILAQRDFPIAFSRKPHGSIRTEADAISAFTGLPVYIVPPTELRPLDR